MSDLKKLYDKYKCDKSSKHNYHEVYEPYFEKVRDQEINILEIGIFRGASMRAHLEYFPNATVYGIDTFHRIEVDALGDVLGEQRSKWMNDNSMDAGLASRMRKHWGKDVKFDFVIDDGAHYPKANMLTLQNVKRFVKPDGTYFIEDVFPLEVMTQKELSIPWLAERPDKYNALDNNMFLNELAKYGVKRYDLRKRSGNPDSYIIAVS